MRFEQVHHESFSFESYLMLFFIKKMIRLAFLMFSQWFFHRRTSQYVHVIIIFDKFKSKTLICMTARWDLDSLPVINFFFMTIALNLSWFIPPLTARQLRAFNFSATPPHKSPAHSVHPESAVPDQTPNHGTIVIKVLMTVRFYDRQSKNIIGFVIQNK